MHHSFVIGFSKKNGERMRKCHSDLCFSIFSWSFSNPGGVPGMYSSLSNKRAARSYSFLKISSQIEIFESFIYCFLDFD